MIKYPECDERDILLCEMIVADNKGKIHRKKCVFCKAEEKDDIEWVLKKLKLESAKSIEIKAEKVIGRKNA